MVDDVMVSEVENVIVVEDVMVFEGDYMVNFV